MGGTLVPTSLVVGGRLTFSITHAHDITTEAISNRPLASTLMFSSHGRISAVIKMKPKSSI